MKTLAVTSTRRTEMIDITSEIRRAIRESGISEGTALIYVPHTTAALTINENADPDVVTDLLQGLERFVPFEAGYRHAEGNSAAHIKASLMGFSETLIVIAGEPLLGTWQSVYFCEFDGPRHRKLHIRISGS